MPGLLAPIISRKYKFQMAFEKGNPGRPKGALNKNPVRSRLADYVGSKWQRFEDEMNKLEGKAYTENFIKLLPFVLPQYQSINFSLRSMSEDDLQYLISKLKENHENEN